MGLFRRNTAAKSATRRHAGAGGKAQERWQWLSLGIIKSRKERKEKQEQSSKKKVTLAVGFDFFCALCIVGVVRACVFRSVKSGLLVSVVWRLTGIIGSPVCSCGVARVTIYFFVGSQ